MKKNIYIMDNIFDGHHIVYMNALEQISNVENISKSCELEVNKKNIIRYVNDRKSILEYALDKVNKGEILHLLYIDPLYSLGPIFKRNKDIRIISTLHHYPQNRLKEKLFKIFSNQVDVIIVHSEYLKEQLTKLGVNNVEVIDYPVFKTYNIYNTDIIKEKFGISKSKYIISALGGTRYDKGLDILIESFKYISEEIKSKIQVNICGKEEDVKEDYIKSKCRELNIDYRLKLGYMTDEEFYENIAISDCIAIPYRSVFTGNSGPMTEGIYQNKPIIAPNSGNLGYLMNKYDLGISFESENTKDLGRAIETLLNEGWVSNEKSDLYKEKLELDTFIRKHEEVYSKYI